MSRDAQAHIDAGLARGLSAEDLVSAAQARLASPVGQPTYEPIFAGTRTTVPCSGDRLDDQPDPGASLPSTPAVPPDTPRIEVLSRYDDLGPIGMGGMGEVRRVRDRRLGRVLALKTLHAPSLSRPSLVSRFLEEAQVTAQLQHPGIVPIHDLGTLPDGRLWFTMKEVTGQTFGEVIGEVHAVRGTRWQPAASGWTLRRLVDALRQVCEAVGYAHNRGVMHRDLKPSNIMVGRHGEVLVLDWGLAKVLGRPERAADDGKLDPVQTARSSDSFHQTMVGMVAGTPAYMSPEQANGEVDRLDARSDVYALGALLYEVLSGRPPFTGNSQMAVLAQVRSGPPAALQRAHSPVHSLGLGPSLRADAAGAQGPPLPPSLVAACERAMARDPADRFDSAAELAAELQAWLDGAKRQQEARALVSRAESKAPEAAAWRAQAATLRAEAAALLKDVADWQPEEDKLPGWEKEDAAAALEKRAELAELEEEQLLQGSLTHAPDLPEAHAALAARYRAEHAAAEFARRDPTRAENLFRQHLTALPDNHADRPGHLAWLSGDGALTLVTDPPGAEVLLHRYVPHNRRLVTRFERSLGTTPLRSVSLPMGSYLCVLKHPDRAAVRYPVSIGRGEHWHGVPPEGGDPMPIPLPRPGELGTDDHYMAPGWFACGGDPQQQRSLSARRIWVDGYIFRRFPVTNAQFLVFLDAMVAEGRVEEALRHAPRERSGMAGEQGPLIYGFDGTQFSLRPDADGDVWEPDWPVMMVDWHGARAFAAWEAARTGQPWQLPGELAREKATRGVDGRFHPWGDGFDPSWASMRRSQQNRLLPTAVGAFPVDESPYGIRDLAGSMCDWCSDAFVETGPPAASARHDAHSGRSALPIQQTDAALQDAHGSVVQASHRVRRGGCWRDTTLCLRAAYRSGDVPTYRDSNSGFRLARPYPWPADP
jgi:serine/threonine protein kinase/formylglycine-generating enzyme required for sulfatase activity